MKMTTRQITRFIFTDSESGEAVRMDIEETSATSGRILFSYQDKSWLCSCTLNEDQSVASFILATNSDYLIEKMLGIQKRIIDEEKIKNDVWYAIVRQRRSRKISASSARALHKRLYDSISTSKLDMNLMQAVLGDDWWQSSLLGKDNPEYNVLNCSVCSVKDILHKEDQKRSPEVMLTQHQQNQNEETENLFDAILDADIAITQAPITSKTLKTLKIPNTLKVPETPKKEIAKPLNSTNNIVVMDIPTTGINLMAVLWWSLAIFNGAMILIDLFYGKIGESAIMICAGLAIVGLLFAARSPLKKVKFNRTLVSKG